MTRWLYEATREVPYLPVQYSQHLLTIGDSKYHCTTPNFQELCIPVAYQFPGNPQQIQIKHFPFLVSPIPFVFLRISGLVFCISAKLDGVKTYMRMRRVPNHLQVKVIKWFDYLWLTQKCSDEERAVSCLPDKLKVSTRGRLRLRTRFVHY